MSNTHQRTRRMQRKPSRHRVRVVGAAMAAALVLAGCGGDGDEAANRSQSEGEQTTAAAAQDAQETRRAPGLVADTITGGQIDVADLLGQDAVLWFWAPW